MLCLSGFARVKLREAKKKPCRELHMQEQAVWILRTSWKNSRTFASHPALYVAPQANFTVDIAGFEVPWHCTGRPGLRPVGFDLISRQVQKVQRPIAGWSSDTIEAAMEKQKERSREALREQQASPGTPHRNRASCPTAKRRKPDLDPTSAQAVAVEKSKKRACQRGVGGFEKQRD